MCYNLVGGKFMDKKIPNHIGIIMDGNGRWAKKRFMPRLYGHREGMKRVVEIVEYCNKINVKSLSLYAFSTENWKRPDEEVNGLMKILVDYVNAELNKLINANIRINIMGDISALPEYPRSKVIEAVEKTEYNTGMALNIGINYGARDEIMRAVNKFISEKPGKTMTRKDFENNLYQKEYTDLDLLIRPGGEKRLSNFMLYQMAYTEIYFDDILWPDYTTDELDRAINWFGRRHRRFGGI